MSPESPKADTQHDFTWHIEYANDWVHEKVRWIHNKEKELCPKPALSPWKVLALCVRQNLTTGAHDNYDCACVPHDMKVRHILQPRQTFM